MLSKETIINIREALEIKIQIAILDETKEKFNKTLTEFDEFVKSIENNVE